jgi:hypothetical protein
MNKFNKKISKLYDEMFGESLTDELAKVKEKIAKKAEDAEGENDGTLTLEEIEAKVVKELTEADEFGAEEEPDDAEAEGEAEEFSFDDDEEEEEEGHEQHDAVATHDEGIDISQIHKEIVSQMEDMSDEDLSYEQHIGRQNIFDLEDQFGPNSNEFVEAFIKLRVASQGIHSSTTTPDADVFAPVWTP